MAGRAAPSDEKAGGVAQLLTSSSLRVEAVALSPTVLAIASGAEL